MPPLSLEGLVANRTMSPEIAETLRKTALARRSFVVIALPRLAGKTTVGRLMLAVAQEDGAALRVLGEDGDDVAALAAEARGGYLYVPEVSRYAAAPGYIWGPPVRAAFAEIAKRTSLATALHADSAVDCIRVLRRSRVPDDDLARLDVIVHLRSLGDDWQHPTRRVVADVHEMAGITDGVVTLRLLHRWDEARDRFEVAAKPARF